MLSKNTTARASVTMLLAWRGFTRVDYHTDEILTYTRETIEGNTIQGSAFIASRIINTQKTGESHVVSLTEGRLANITRALNAHTTINEQERLLFVADIDANTHRVLIGGFDYDALTEETDDRIAISRKMNGGRSFNFARFDALRDAAVVSGVIDIH